MTSHENKYRKYIYGPNVSRTIFSGNAGRTTIVLFYKTIKLLSERGYISHLEIGVTLVRFESEKKTIPSFFCRPNNEYNT